MSIEIMTEVWKHAPCAENDLLVLLAIADSGNDERECWPSLRTIARKTRITLKECLLIVQDLELQGFVEVEHRKDVRRGNLSNKYHIRKVEDWLLLWAYDYLNAPDQPRTEGGVSKSPSTGNRVFQTTGGSETGVFQSAGAKVTESSVETSEKRERSTRTGSTSAELHPLIALWATYRGIDAVNIGAPIYSTKDLAAAKRMSKWTEPPLAEEVKAAIHASKAHAYAFQWLEADIPRARLDAAKKSAPSPAAKQADDDKRRHDYEEMFGDK